jgi:hypothetical protein
MGKRPFKFGTYGGRFGAGDPGLISGHKDMAHARERAKLVADPRKGAGIYGSSVWVEKRGRIRPIETFEPRGGGVARTKRQPPRWTRRP